MSKLTFYRKENTMTDQTLADDLLDGAAAIGEYLGVKKRRAMYLLETHQIPGFQLGRRWHARRSTLRRFIEEQERAEN